MTTYFIIDGDDIGNKIIRRFIENDETGLRTVIGDLVSILQDITHHLERLGCEVIYCAADGITGKGERESIELTANIIKEIGSPSYSFSMGVGDSIREAYLALSYAKSIGKNKTVVYRGGEMQIYK